MMIDCIKYAKYYTFQTIKSFHSLIVDTPKMHFYWTKMPATPEMSIKGISNENSKEALIIKKNNSIFLSEASIFIFPIWLITV